MKQKSHSGAKKRFSQTGTGKIVHRGAAISHLLSHKNKNSKKEHHKSNNILNPSDRKELHRLLPYM